MESSNNQSALELSAHSADVDSFLSVKNIYEIFLSRNEIKKLVLTFDEAKFPDSFITNLNTNVFLLDPTEFCIEIAKFLFHLFEDEIWTLKKLFKHRRVIEGDNKSDTILKAIWRKDSECFTFFKEKWQKIYKNESFEANFSEMMQPEILLLTY